MNSCHGAWSVGAVAGSVLGSSAAHLGLSRTAHYALLAALLVPVAIACGRTLLPTHVDQVGAHAPGRTRLRWHSGWTRRVLLLGSMGAIVLTCEAAVINWSGVFLLEHLGASIGVAGLGFVAFAAARLRSGW